MVCLALKPNVVGRNAQTNPLSYSGTPNIIAASAMALRA